MVHGKLYCENMQTVPSGLSPLDYSAFAADSFDLSLLPCSDSEVPLSPPSQLVASLSNNKQFSNDFYDIPTTIFHDTIDLSQLKTEKDFYPVDQKPYYFDNKYYDTDPFFQHQLSAFHSPAPSPNSSGEDCPGFAVQPPSPVNNLLSYIKEEPLGGLLFPPSPPNSCYSYGSSTPSSPHYLAEGPQSPYIKPEICTDFEELLKEPQQPPVKKDYQLLREVLEDTSFQKKFNLRPVALETLWAHSHAASSNITTSRMDAPNNGGLMEVDGDIEPVLSLALQQVKKDVQAACAVLDISPDPMQWGSTQVKAWLSWTISQFNLPSVPAERFSEDGPGLIQLSEEEFSRRAPQSGSILYAQLEIWKAARLEQTNTSTSSSWGTSTQTQLADISDEDEEETETPQPPAAPVAPVIKPPTRQGGSHIHLWQFLKELLSSPQAHGTAIRWLDRGKGIFKIEDSVRVAKLWGRRKNRPAMNYDKLSRSIRQYYKKGIMKKTERSQRLVYQFCHPYCV